MKWLKDSTGRFPERPYYDAGELDDLSEELIINFLHDRYGCVSFPVSTEDLTVLIESETSDLDQYADLTLEGDDVEGVTLFFPDRKPVIKIAEGLAATGYREHRLRTTLTHEFVHVKMHSSLWRFNSWCFFRKKMKDRGRDAGVVASSAQRGPTGWNGRRCMFPVPC